LPDLFKGGQLVVAGRYRGNPSGAVRLTGYSQDHPESFTMKGFGESAARSSLAPRIWATRKIGYLLDQVRLHQNQEVVEEIVRLSKEYGILTPYTSYLADERQDQVLRPETSGGHFFYNLDSGIVRRAEQESAQELSQLGLRRDVTGLEETHRALNSKGYQS